MLHVDSRMRGTKAVLTWALTRDWHLTHLSLADRVNSLLELERVHVMRDRCAVQD